MQTEKVVNHIVQWLKDYALNAKMNGFVIGISGGIDSAVTSTLCARTGLELLCLEMPIHQAENQVTRASDHIQWLQHNFSDVKRLPVDLTPVFDSLVSALPKVDTEESRFMSLANTRARLRMTTLYYFAGLHRFLVVGTGNKIEDFGVGFFTKYGDGGVDLSPIADLTKTEVYKIAEKLDVPQSILKTSPTDGLFGDSRTDEMQLGASYPELEKAMKQMEKGVDENELSGRELTVFKIYKRLHRANLHKIKPIPVCEIPESWKS